MQESILSKWGNSLALRIPKDVLADAGLKEGDAFSVEASDQSLTFRRVRKIRRYSMEEVLDSLHSVEEQQELDWGVPVGKEVL